MTGLDEQSEAIRSAIDLSPGFYIKQIDGGLLIGNDRLAFFMKPDFLSQDNYLEIAKISFGRLLEALDQWLENTPAQGNA